ncbi:MAG TPA: hypothetical protein PLL44_08010 [Novosphingobium sp.]|jgi:hypothetical protein|nr:hypothetical protein [Novosphingobium sp.]HQD99584.1 hypothetical protein [Novosphingobium sp.]HQN54360.1 hypothetical protein [Novosphingobium sp.]
MRHLDTTELTQGFNASLEGRVYPDVGYIKASTSTETRTLAVGGINGGVIRDVRQFTAGPIHFDLPLLSSID